MQDFEEAKRVFLATIRRLAPTARLLSGLGETLFRLNQFDEAEKRLREAIELEPASVAPHLVLAKLYHAIGDRDKFGAAASQAIALDPQNYQTCFYYGLWLLEYGGKTAQGAAYIRKSIELRPRFGEGLKMWGRILSQEGRWEEAARCYERAIALDPDDAQSVFLLSRAYRKLGEREKAEQAIARYRTLNR